WGLGVTTTKFTRHLGWLDERHESLRLYCAHNEQVVRLPDGAVVLGHDPIAAVSAYSIGDHVLCTQHHPEMTPDYVDGLLDYIEADIDPAVMAKARDSVKGGAQGGEFARWIVDFYDAAHKARGAQSHHRSHRERPVWQDGERKAA
ncbi:MAG TPA: hypothetical protein PKE65_06355, partial [Rhizobiaceae bacterium]|nr:hypothetical protein [Rhizobiaceae bacterium]